MPVPNQIVIDALRSIKGGWQTVIQNGLRWKSEVFGRQAAEALTFYDGSCKTSDLYSMNDSKLPKSAINLNFNKVAEVVQLFGPTLYPENPTRMVTAMSQPEIAVQDMVQAAMISPQVKQAQQMMLQQGMDAAMAQQQSMAMAQQMAMQQAQQYQVEAMGTTSRNQITASLISKYLNYTPGELDLRDNMRRVVNEAVVKGMGCCWTDVVTMPLTGQKIVGSFFDSVDNYLHDPDMSIADDRSCKWQARLCIHPVWEVEADFGLQPGTLKGNLQSVSNAMQSGQHMWSYRAESNKTNDQFAYWKIWSKMGVGDRLPGLDQKMRQTMGRYGDYVFLVIADDVDYPLNLPPDFVGSSPDEEIMKRMQWPWPAYGDNDWPCTPLAFHQNFKANYPMSHIRFALGEIQFMNWMVSMIAQKINITHRDIIAVAASASDEIEKQIREGGDLSIIKFKSSQGIPLSEQVQFLQHPTMNTDIMKVIPLVTDMLEKRLGTGPLLYGESEGIFRSASEAEIKNNNSRSRIDSMAKDVANCSATIAKKEAIAARTVLGPNDIRPVFLEVGSALWGQYVATADATTIYRQLEYSVEESSVRRPNRERLASNLKDAVATLLPVLNAQAGQTGDFTAVNNLIRDWGKSVDLDTTGYALRSIVPGSNPPQASPSPPQTAPKQAPVGSNN